MDIVAQLIGSIGFPIVAYLILFEYMKKRDETFTTALNNNTKAIERLTEKIIERGESHEENQR